MGIRRRFARGIPRIVDLYGYHRDGRDLIENPEQSAVVRMIFQWVLMRYSVSEIKELLRMYKIPSHMGATHGRTAPLCMYFPMSAMPAMSLCRRLLFWIYFLIDR